MKRFRSRRGMTLIEVMVVVAILLVVMSILSLSVFGTLSSSQVHDEKLRQARQSELAELEQLRHPDPLPAPGPATPEVRSAAITVALDAEPVAEWPWVHTLLDVRFEGRYVLVNPDPTLDEVRVWLPIPEGARGVRFEVDGEPGLPPGAVYTGDGIAWVVPLDGDRSLPIVLAWQAPAVDRFAWSVPGAHAGPVDLDVSIALPTGFVATVSDGTLAPTTRSASSLQWALEDVVSSGPIRIEIPASATPLGRVTLVCWLAAGGLLLFCGGLWYLAEGERPGHLDDFRFGGLLLLALNYASFYAIFAVLALKIGLWAAPIALLASLPLLALHVARLTSRRFALFRVTPLAGATIVGILAFSYFEPWRPVVVLGAGLAAVAGVTVTWRSWSDARRAWVAVAEGQQVRRLSLDRLEQATAGLRQALDLGSSLLTSARRALCDLPPGLGAERAETQRTVERFERGLARARALVGIPDTWDLLGEASHHEHCAVRLTEIARARTAIDELGLVLTAAVGGLEKAATRAMNELSSALVRMERGVDELALVEVEVRAVSAEAPVRLRREVDPALAQVAVVRGEAAALAERVARPDGGDLRSLAVSALQIARAATGLDERLRGALGPLGDALRRTDQPEDPQETGVHCPVCGGIHATGSRFCSGCGAMRPAEIACGACGRVSRLPHHLLRDDWQRARVHCGGCGVEAASGGPGLRGTGPQTSAVQPNVASAT